MKNGYFIVSECLDNIPTRPISTLSKDTSKEAGKISKMHTAKETKDPDPKKLGNDKKDKGQASGDSEGTVEKELDKIKNEIE